MQLDEMKSKLCHKSMGYEAQEQRLNCIGLKCIACHKINDYAYECLDLREGD